jgi:signal transduction histidine kinase
MDLLSDEIALVLIGSAFFLLVAVGIVILFLVYQKKQLQNLIQKQDVQNQFQQELLSTRLEAQEHTLNMVGQEIHDNIGQVLSLVKLNLHKAMSEQGELTSPVLNSTKDLVSKAIQDLRTLSKTLNTGYLSNSPLCESLRYDLSIVQQSGSFETRLEVSGTEPDLNPQKKIVIFRMAQEIINNAIKHSKATIIQVILTFSESHLRMIIEDNGIGFNSASLHQKKSPLPSGTGLGNLFLRANLIGAEFSIESSESKGTKAFLNLAL